MTKRHVFRPSLNDVLEDRIALSQLAAVHAAVAHPQVNASATPVLRQRTLNDANQRIDAAFNQFQKDYTVELSGLNRSGNSAQFQTRFDQSVTKLRKALTTQAGRIPGGSTTLNTDLQQRVDSLVQDLKNNKTTSPTSLVKSDQAGAHHDLAGYVHDASSKGEFSIR